MVDDDVVGSIGYRPGWRFKRGGPGGRYLCVFVTSADTTRPDRERCTQHMFEIPAVEGRELARWVFARLMDIERHEAAEWFRWDGRHVFWPFHQDEGSPYAAVERWEN
jgi:hypothetical protein